jgi:hypothetical protein
LIVIDLSTGRIVGYVRINSGFTELFDVAVLPGVRNPMTLGLGSDEIIQTALQPGLRPFEPLLISPRCGFLPAMSLARGGLWSRSRRFS